MPDPQNLWKAPNGQWVDLSGFTTEQADQFKAIVFARLAPTAPTLGRTIQTDLDTARRQLQGTPSIDDMMQGLWGTGWGGVLPRAVTAAPSLGESITRQGVAALLNVVAHPQKHLPEIVAAATTALAQRFAPGMNPQAILSRVTAAGAGGAAGRALQEDGTPSDLFMSGMGQAALQGLGGEALAGTGVLARTLGRRMGAAAIAPSPELLAQMRDPQGKLFDTYADAAKAFTDDVLTVAKGNPRSSAYAKDLQRQVDQAIAAKQAALAGAPPLSVIDPEVAIKGITGTRPSRFDKLYGDLAAKSESPAAAQESIQKTIGRFFGGSGKRPQASASGRPVVELDPATSLPVLDPTTGLPALVPPASPTIPMSPTQAAKLTTGLSEALNRRLTQRMGGWMKGERPLMTPSEQALEAMRGNLAEAVHEVVPETKALDALITRLIPYRQAAEQATIPQWGASIPRVAAIGGGTKPGLTFRAYESIAGPMRGRVARPLDALGRALAGATFLPNALRSGHL